MALIEAQTIGEAHEATIRLILEEGLEQSIETEPGKIMKTWELPDPLLVVIRRPWMDPMHSAALPYGEGMLGKYCQDLLTVGPTGFSYTYANRLMDYRRRVATDVCTGPNEESHTEYILHGDGDGRGIDQIDALCRKLATSPDSRRALAITWIPEVDADAIEPPCLQFVHCMIRPDMEGLALSLRAAFRSHDMLLGAGPNWLALYGLQDHIAARVSELSGKDIGIGSLCTVSSSAHIYVEAQSEELRAFKRVLRMA